MSPTPGVPKKKTVLRITRFCAALSTSGTCNINFRTRHAGGQNTLVNFPEWRATLKIWNALLGPMTENQPRVSRIDQDFVKSTDFSRLLWCIATVPH
jgi:hypothetical protein